MKPPDIDARGLGCPKPVLKTKEKLAQTKDLFTIMVDNEAARDNVSRFATSSGCTVDISEVDECFLLSITPGASSDEEAKAQSQGNMQKIISITSDELGKGDRELGVILMKSFLYACTENDEMPSKIVIMNSGARLAVENEDTVEYLKNLEENGVEILVCGTCLDFYHLKEKLSVGRISNMYEIQSALIGADLLVCL